MSVLPRRHWAKAFTWRLVASITTFLIGWMVTGDLNFGMAIGAADVLIKIILYYFHERMWYHSNFGIIDDGHQSEMKPLFKKKSKIQEIQVPVNQNLDKNKKRTV